AGACTRPPRRESHEKRAAPHAHGTLTAPSRMRLLDCSKMAGLTLSPPVGHPAHVLIGERAAHNCVDLDQLAHRGAEVRGLSLDGLKLSGIGFHRTLPVLRGRAEQTGPGPGTPGGAGGDGSAPGPGVLGSFLHLTGVDGANAGSRVPQPAAANRTVVALLRR